MVKIGGGKMHSLKGYHDPRSLRVILFVFTFIVLSLAVMLGAVKTYVWTLGVAVVVWWAIPRMSG
tara:strand:+ start:535 stop:729 length:195 start_codon:yes stop_codon:yes gene_type:complete